jgi:hypothetical protein
MTVSVRYLGTTAVALALACVLASAAGAVVVRTPDGHRYGVMLRKGVTPGSLAGVSPARSSGKRADNGTLTYTNGVVLHSSAPYLVFWDPAGQIPASSRGVIAGYLGDVAAASGTATNVYSVLRQYTDTTGFADYRQTFSAAQAILDAQPYPVRGCAATAAAYPTCLTDAQVQAELARLIAARHLPAGTGANAPVYDVVTPQSVNICFRQSGGSCSSNAFCAYHSFFAGPVGSDVLYALTPFFVFQYGPKGCQTDGTANYQTPHGSGDHGYQIADNLSHELSETITDPTFGGWFDPASGSEVGDECATYGATANPAAGLSPLAYQPTLGGTENAGTLFDQVINGNEYYNQTEWSNGDINCRAQTSPGTIAPAFTAPAHSTVGTAVTLDPSASSSTAGFSSETWDFGDGSASVFNRGAPAATSHTFTARGTYRVTLTVVDMVGNLATTSRTVSVS